MESLIVEKMTLQAALETPAANRKPSNAGTGTSRSDSGSEPVAGTPAANRKPSNAGTETSRSDCGSEPVAGTPVANHKPSNAMDNVNRSQRTDNQNQLT